MLQWMKGSVSCRPVASQCFGGSESRLHRMMHAQRPPEQQAGPGQCDDGVNEYSSDDLGIKLAGAMLTATLHQHTVQ
jgi:hypothetical protein